MPSSDDEFDAFFRKSYSGLVAHLVIMGLPWESARDSAQEAMMLAYQNWGELLDEEAWVRKVALRHARRTYGRDLMRLRKEGEVASRSLPGNAEVLPEDQADARNRGKAVIAAIQSLPPAQRIAMAFLVDGYSPTEIAQITGQNVATVRSNIRHARRHLKYLFRHDEGSADF